jgi:HAD superfamily hydrolase (TIGR01509 family)
MMERATVLWDNDGVLVDTEFLYFRATQEVLASVGIELTQEQFVEISLKLGRSAFELVAQRGLSFERVERLREARNSTYAASLRQTAVAIDGVEEVLRHLHGQFAMGVVTSSRREHFDIIHRASGLLPYFDFVITREDYDRSKPHADPYLTAIARHDLDRANCVVVEDSERGLLSAKAAGLRCLIVPNGLTAGGDFRDAFKVLPSIREVIPEILRLATAKGER